MARSKSISFERQASFSVGLGIVSVVGVIGMAVLLAKNYQPEVGQIEYGSTGNFFIAFIGAVGLALVTGLTGILLGFHSAGQKKNSNSKLSWTGFFVNAVAITLALSFFVIFWLLKLKINNAA